MTHSDYESIAYDVKFKKLYPDAEIPQYAHEGDVGFDLIAHNFIEHHSFRMNGTPVRDKIDPEAKSILLIPHSRLLVGCGYALELPVGLQLEIRGRSGNALERGIVLAHGTGTIDNGYRGEISFLVLNTSDYATDIVLGEKIGQGVLMPYYVASFIEVTELSETSRGEKGFGSTGYKAFMSNSAGVHIDDPIPDRPTKYDKSIEKRGYPDKDNTRIP